MSVRLTLVGALGRMGRTILTCLDSSHFDLIEVVERPSSQHIGKTLADIIKDDRFDNPIVGHLSSPCDVVIDFATGDGFAELVHACAQNGWAFVSGRTGISEQDQQALAEASRSIAVLHAGNMSLGANLLTVLCAQAASALDEADIEIIEAHHIHKKDAPSGTALMVADAIKDVRQLKQDDFIHGRSGHTGEKPAKQIAIHALRTGETVGEHSAWFALPGERIEVSHKAFDRSIFARGALKAASWIVTKESGLWSMKDVLGL